MQDLSRNVKCNWFNTDLACDFIIYTGVPAIWVWPFFFHLFASMGTKWCYKCSLGGEAWQEPFCFQCNKHLELCTWMMLRMEQIYFSHTRLIAECQNLNHSVVCVCAVRVKICACQPWQSLTFLYLRWIFAGSGRNPSGPISRSHTASTPLQSSISQTLTLPMATQGTSEHNTEPFKLTMSWSPSPLLSEVIFPLIIFWLIL